jgi:SAM-dependent methyltransferase
MTEYSIEEKEQREIDAWRGFSCDHLGSIAFKFAESRAFLVKLGEYETRFSGAGKILEIGGGQGWAACMVKRLFPVASVFASDISPYAVAQIPEWERILKVALDGSFACRSYDIPLETGSVDLVYCFEAAHHFVAQRRTLQEVHRVLRVGGCCLYLREPSCRPFLHSLAHRRANAKRPEVPEDVLRYAEVLRLAREVGFEPSVRFDPSLINRQPLELMYYYTLTSLPFFRSLLPCTADYVFRKQA